MVSGKVEARFTSKGYLGLTAPLFSAKQFIYADPPNPFIVEDHAGLVIEK